ncbi:hypothetical protein BD560DRAFT_437994 [Blakeslea trispora]|nr:hypothetical protein BD560DRAFT_437994 [Blakeslea trispora]
MKRSNDTQTSQQAEHNFNEDSNKRPRYTQSNYSDMYAQYGLMSQYNAAASFPQVNTAAQYAGYGQPMYGASYANPQYNMMATQYAGYPQGFPAAVAAAAVGVGAGANPAGEPSRTIYLGNVVSTILPHDILRNVRHGQVESFRMVPEKNCAFLAFVDPSSAQMFYQDFMAKKLIIKDTEIKVGWGKPSMIPYTLKLSIDNGATRNVYLGRLTAEDTEQTIHAALTRFGPIEHIKLVRDKNIAFVHFLSIMAAVKCVGNLPSDPAWAEKRVNYGKDRCGDMVDSYNAAMALHNPYATAAAAVAANGFNFEAYSSAYGGHNMGNNTQRTLYFGNIHPEATCEDICNAIRGGNLLQIRYFPEKHIAFVTFMDANTASNVYTNCNTFGLAVKGKRVRVGWGKPSSVSTQVAIAVQNGATRNIYIGNICDSHTAEKLRNDFSEYGEIELINVCKEKNCAFVNFTSVSSAINALQGAKTKSGYSQLKLNYGKDRCGNPWRMNKPKIPTDEKKAEDKKDEIKAEANAEGFGDLEHFDFEQEISQGNAA